MRRKFLAKIFLLTFILPAVVFSQGILGRLTIPFLQQDIRSKNALDFYLRYPQQPIPFDDCKNIKQLNNNLYKPEDILKDFEKNKKEGQVGAIVIVKTENCCRNEFRPCATTTAVFEKEASEKIKKFKVYGIQVLPGDLKPTDPKEVNLETTPWKIEVKKIYQFKQGPGATIVVILPNGKRFRTDAGELELNDRPFRERGGQVPKLDKFLDRIIRDNDRTPSSPVISYLGNNPKGEGLTLERLLALEKNGDIVLRKYAIVDCKKYQEDSYQCSDRKGHTLIISARNYNSIKNSPPPSAFLYDNNSRLIEDKEGFFKKYKIVATPESQRQLDNRLNKNILSK